MEPRRFVNAPRHASTGATFQHKLCKTEGTSRIRLRGMANETRARVLIVEDHQVVADGLAALINDQNDMTVVGQAGSVVEAI